MEGTWVLQNTPVTMTGEGGECFGPMRFSVSAATLTIKLTASGQISVMGQCRLQLLCFTVMNDTCEFIFKRTSGEGGPGTVYTCCGYGAEEFTSAEEITALDHYADGAHSAQVGQVVAVRLPRVLAARDDVALGS